MSETSKTTWFQCERCREIVCVTVSRSRRRICDGCRHERRIETSRERYRRERERLLAERREYLRINRDVDNARRRAARASRTPEEREHHRRLRAASHRRSRKPRERVDERPSTRAPNAERAWPYLDTPLPYAFDSFSPTLDTILLGDPLDILIAHRAGYGYDETGLSDFA